MVHHGEQWSILLQFAVNCCLKSCWTDGWMVDHWRYHDHHVPPPTLIVSKQEAVVSLVVSSQWDVGGEVNHHHNGCQPEGRSPRGNAVSSCHLLLIGVGQLVMFVGKKSLHLQCRLHFNDHYTIDVCWVKLGVAILRCGWGPGPLWRHQELHPRWGCSRVARLRKIDQLVGSTLQQPVVGWVSSQYHWCLEAYHWLLIFLLLLAIVVSIVPLVISYHQNCCLWTNMFHHPFP